MPFQDTPHEDGAQEPDIIVEDESWASGFTQVPNIVLRAPQLSIGAKLTYSMLLSYAWQKGSCFPGQETMARDMGCSVRSVVNYINELKEQGVVIVQRRGLGRTNLYRLPKFQADARRTYKG